MATLLVMASQNALATEAATTRVTPEPTIAQTIESKFIEATNTISFNYVEPLGDTGLHAVQHNGSYMVVSEDLDILLTGTSINLKDKVDLKKEWVKKSISPILDELTQDEYTVYPANGETIDVLWVLSDLSCGYCQSLHEQFPLLTSQGIEIRVIPFVRGLNSDVSKKNYDNTMAIYSTGLQEERRQLQERAFSGEYVGKNAKIDPNAKKILDKGFKVGLNANITGTPLMINSNGNTLAGLADTKFIVENFIPSK